MKIPFIDRFLRSEERELTPEELAILANQNSIAWSETSAFLQSRKYNPDDLIGRKGPRIYRNMMMDEQVKAVVEFKISSIMGRDWYFELDPEKSGLSDEEAQRRVDICTKAIEAYNGSWNDGLRLIMKALWQGFSMTEKIFDLFDYEGSSYWHVCDLRGKPFDSFEVKTTDTGDVIAWYQSLGGQEKEIDLRKFVYYRYHPEMDEHYGWSDLRAAYRGYISKDVAINFFNYYLEKLSSGFLVAKPKEGTTLTRGSDLWNTLTSILKNATGKSSILLPSNVDLEIVQPNGSQVNSFEKAIEIHDLSIAKALLVPNLLGLSHTGQTGAYSQSETQFEVYLSVVDNEAERLEEAINEQIFRPLATANFIDGITPKFRFKEMSDRKKMALLKTWSELITSGSVEASDTDELHIREMLEFPEKGEPIKEPPPPVAGPQPVVPPDEGQSTPVGRGSEDQVNETVHGSPVRIVSKAAFEKAMARVSFAVIDRKSETGVVEYTGKTETEVFAAVSDALARIEEKALGSGESTVDDIKGFDLNGFRVRAIKNEVERALKFGYSLGEDHAKREIDSAKGEVFAARRFNFDRLGDLAAEFFKQRAFAISGDIKNNVVKTIKTSLFNGLKYSWSQSEIKRDILKRLLNEGFLSGESVAEELGFESIAALSEELAVKGGLEPYRLNTIIRTNMFESLNEARLNAFTDPSLDGFVRALEYSAILDSRTTAICSHLDGRVYAADDTVWNSIRPPNHFNCRSILVPVTIIDDDVELTEGKPTLPPQEGFG